jgi:hypothetical protein
MRLLNINKELLDDLFEQAKENPRLRQNYDLRTSPADSSQRMLNAMMPETNVPIHRHEDTTETVVCLCGKLDEVIYEEVDPLLSPLKKEDAAAFERGMDAQDVTTGKRFREIERIRICPKEGKHGCQIPKGAWHSVEVIEPSVIFEAKDGAYKPR